MECGYYYMDTTMAFGGDTKEDDAIATAIMDEDYP